MKSKENKNNKKSIVIGKKDGNYYIKTKKKREKLSKTKTNLSILSISFLLDIITYLIIIYVSSPTAHIEEVIKNEGLAISLYFISELESVLTFC